MTTATLPQNNTVLRKRLAWLTLFTLIVTVSLSGQSLDGIRKTSEKESIDYLITLPEGYSKTGDAVPLILFLHGGDGSNTKHHPKKYATSVGLSFPFMVVAPQCSRGCSWASVDYEALLGEVLRDYNVDQTRVYVTGYSMGGYGTWSAISKYPELFTAAVPIAGGGNTSTVCNAKKVAIWAFHGDKDSITPYSGSQKLIEKLKGCGANAILETVKGQDHWIWPTIYKDIRFYEWLLEQKKAK